MNYAIVLTIYSSRDKNGDMRCMNMYDIRMKEERHPECGLSWPYELEDVTRYLRVRKPL